MEASPLVQQARPSFQPKIAQLYEELFQDEDEQHSEGFWAEFFLLKPDKPSLVKRLDALDAEDLLDFQHETQQIFLQALQHIKNGRTPSDEVSLDTLTVFLDAILSKRYINPTTEIITVLAGLDEVDTVFTDFANIIEATIRTGRSLDVRKKAIEVALSLTAGAYQTGLVSYFTHKDLFPALMKYIQDADTDDRAYEPSLLLGLLANYNKFEFRNPYRLRLEDFVNEDSIQKIIRGVAHTCIRTRNKYGEIIDDLSPETGWSLSRTLAYIGLGILAPIKAINPIAIQEDHQEKFAALPDPDAAIFLPVYDFVSANKLFGYNLVNAAPTTPRQETPLCAYLSLSSYILHHAYRSTRATVYGVLSLITIRIILEDPSLCKSMCSGPLINVRLCRQRPPLIPPTPEPRPPAAQILDIAADTLNHNLRRRLDVDLYLSSLNLIHRLLVCLAQNHIHLSYHWPLLWQSLLSLVRFLTTYAADLQSTANITSIILPLLNTLVLAIATGNAFLPDATAYDDLVYKLVEHSDVLTKFKAAYSVPSPSPSAPSLIDTLIATSKHFHDILEAEKGKGRFRNVLSTKEVSRVIREGYESLEVSEVGSLGVEGFPIWREGEERGLLRKIARMAVDNVREMIGRK